jgi:hypothetical protein
MAGKINFNSKSSYVIPDTKMFDDSVAKQALFDRIINVQITRAPNEGETVKDWANHTFTIRSDYEIVEGNKGKQIQKCHIKPSMRFTYKQVAGSLATSADLYIDNFYMFAGEGDTSLLSFSAGKNAIKSVEVTLGYAPMFEKPRNTYEFFGYQGMNSPLSLNCPDGAVKVRIDVEWANFTSTAPNATFHIHGWVGSIQKGLQPNIENDKIKSSEDALWFTYNFQTAKGTFFERAVNYLITKRFPRDANEFALAKDIQYDSNGYMTDSTAQKYGVKVHVPESSYLMTLEGINKYAKAKGETGEQVTLGNNQKVWLSSADSVKGTLEMIRANFCPHLMFSILDTGDWIAWDDRDISTNYFPETNSKGEKDNWGNPKKQRDYNKRNAQVISFMEDASALVNEEVHKAQEKGRVYTYAIDTTEYSRENKGTPIPVIYAVTENAGLCTVTCPFFTLLNPFQKLIANARYYTSDMASYFAKKDVGMVEFFVVNSIIDFATVDDINTMTMQLVGLNDYNAR